MKKLSNNGFMLTETLIVATMIMTVLLVLYVQFENVTKSYNSSFTYNTVNNLYAANNIEIFLKNERLDLLKTDLQNQVYIDISSCYSKYYDETDYCSTLYNDLNVKTILFTGLDLTELKKDNHIGSEGLKDFISTVSYSNSESGYSLIIEFYDKTYANIKLR